MVDGIGPFLQANPEPKAAEVPLPPENPFRHRGDLKAKDPGITQFFTPDDLGGQSSQNTHPREVADCKKAAKKQHFDPKVCTMGP